MNNELELLKGLLRSGRDLAGTIGSAVVAEPIAGIGGLATLARTGDTAKAAERIEALRDRLTYQPKDEASQRSLELFAKPFQALEEHVIRPVSDAAYEVGGPVAGAAMNTALNMVDPLRGKGKAAKKAKPPKWQVEGLPPPKGWYDANKDPVALEQQARMEALRKKQPHLFEDQPAPVFEHEHDPMMFDRDPDEVLNPQQRAPLDQKFGTDTDVDWGGPPEGGLFNFNDPMHYDYVAEFVDPDGTIPQAQLDTAVRHEMARMNATAPTEIGGLGLGPNNTPMERAKALGFEGDYFHGSLSSGIEHFDPARDRGSNWAGSGTYTTTNPADASTNYANPYGIDIAEKMREAKMYFEERMDPNATGEMDMPDGMTPTEYGQVANALDAQSSAGYNQLANRDQYGAPLEATEKMVKAMGLGDSLGTVYPLMLRKGKELNAAKAAEHVPVEDIHQYMQDQIQSRAWISDDGPLAVYRDQPGAVPDSVARELFNKLEINPRDLIRDFDLPNDFNTFTHRPKFGFPHEKSEDLHVIAREPKQVRSRFAAFDPGQRESPNIMALQGLDPREILKRKLRETAINAGINAGEQQGE